MKNRKVIIWLLPLILGSLISVHSVKANSDSNSIIPKSNWIKLTNYTQGADNPVWSPDGKEIVYITWDNTPTGTIYKMEADGSNRTSLGISGVGSPDISPDGTKITVQSYGSIYVLNYDGTNFHRVFDGLPNVARWSPAGTRLAVDERTHSEPSTYRIVIINSDGTNPTPLTNINQSFLYPYWSPDGTKISCQSYVEAENARGFNGDIWIMDADGKNLHQLTYFDNAVYPVWSPVEPSIFFVRYSSSWSDNHIFKVSIDGTNIVQLTNGTGEWMPTISPDGAWMAFTAYDENGIRNVYKTRLPLLDLTPIWMQWWFWTISILSIIAVLATFTALHYRKRASKLKENKAAPSKLTQKEYIVCPNCNAQLPTDSKFCGKCGTSLE